MNRPKVTNGQFSDNKRGYVIKATTPLFGAQKSVINSTFVGMTRNTGHRYCSNWKRPEAGHDFVTIGDCGSSLDRKSPKTMKDFPGRPWPAGNMNNFWFKPIGDVYRNSVGSRFYPTQGMSIYDTWMLQSIKNNVFYDFFSDKEGTDGFRHAVGVHFSNNFHVVVKNCFVSNMTYHNTARHIQMGLLDCTEVGCNDETYTEVFGDNWGQPALYKALSDGELTMGFYDQDGHFNNGESAYILAPEIKMFTTGCRQARVPEVSHLT